MILTVATLAEQRRRSDMEDRHALEFWGSNKIDGLMFGGVYDGHGGSRVATVAAERLPILFRSALEKLDPKSAFRSAYRKLSKEIVWDDNGSGSCAANFLVTNESIIHANIGDTRVVVVGDDVVQLTTDDRVSDRNERRRVIRHGSVLDSHYMHYNGRGIMVTRSFGDSHFKPGGQLDRPHVGVHKLRSTDRFLVAATDGLFDNVENEIILELSRKTKTATAEEFLLLLKEQVEVENGGDNLTVVVVGFEH